MERMTRLGCVVALSIAACATSPVPPDATSTPIDRSAPPGQECASFGADPSDSFYAFNDLTYTDPTPLEWESASPSDLESEQALLEEAADNAAMSGQIASMLVVRDGKVAFERYFNGSDASRAHNVQSLSKSILSLVTGIAIDSGAVELDSTIGEFLPAALVGQHGDLTVEHLLTMSGGLRVDDAIGEYWYDDTPSDEPGEPSFVRAVLERPSVASPGSVFEYSTGLTQVLSAVITEATGQTLCAYAADRLLGPLGVDVEKWWVEPGGYFSGGHSLFLTPREIARVGQLVLQRGEWGGRQLVPEAWLDASMAESWELGCRGVGPVHVGYGFLWWLFDVDGREVWQAAGAGGQELWIVDDLDLVLVITHDSSRLFEADREEVSGLAVLRRYLLGDDANSLEPECESAGLKGHTIRPDGTGRSQILGWPEGALPTSWSADGSSVAVAMDGRDLNSEIYTLALDGTVLYRLTDDLAFDAMPAWSPDGRTVAFARGGPGDSDLYLVSADGTDLTRLTAFAGYEHSPSWSVDGSSIVFVRGQGDAQGHGATGQLWRIGADGSEPTLVLDESIGYPAWSPDGRHIALELRGDVTHIGVLDLDTGDVVDLGEGYVPRWSPDGSRLAFAADHGAGSDIYVMGSDGTNVVQLTRDESFDTFPVWSHDGAWILFLSASEG